MVRYQSIYFWECGGNLIITLEKIHTFYDGSTTSDICCASHTCFVVIHILGRSRFFDNACISKLPNKQQAKCEFSETRYEYRLVHFDTLDKS